MWIVDWSVCYGGGVGVVDGVWGWGWFWVGCVDDDGGDGEFRVYREVWTVCVGL